MFTLRPEMKHLDGLFQVSLAGDALSTKEKEFIVLGIVLPIHCEPCTLVHLEKALAAGATKTKEFVEKGAEVCAWG